MIIIDNYEDYIKKLKILLKGENSIEDKLQEIYVLQQKYIRLEDENK